MSSAPLPSGGRGGLKAPTFPEVYCTHFSFVWRTLRRLGVREADLLDATQNVFVVVHRQLSGFEGRSKMRTWLFWICRRITRDYLRSAPIRREVVVDVRSLGSLPAASTDNPLRRLASEERSRMLEAILDRLPEKLRVAFVLFELEEMPGEDIAHLLAVPLGTVRSRLRLAREALRREVAVLGGVDASSEIEEIGTLAAAEACVGHHG